MVQVRREFPSEPRCLAELRAMVRQACVEAWQIHSNDPTIMHLELAIHEAAANIIRHAHGGDAQLPIEVALHVDGDEFSATLFHNGPAFDPSDIQPPVFDGTRVGGFGVYLIGKCLDAVEYSREPGGRGVVRMVKRRVCTAEPGNRAKG